MPTMKTLPARWRSRPSPPPGARAEHDGVRRPCLQTAPTGPAPRLPSGKPDFTGVWQRAYMPDMSRNGRGQQGFAEPPFAPNDSPAKREELRKAGNFAELPFTPAGLERLEDLRCRQRRIHRQLHAVRPEPIDQLARSDADHAERQVPHPALRAEHVVPHHPHRRPRAPQDVEPTWFGHSIGKWDGDTLIVDTVGFNG